MLLQLLSRATYLAPLKVAWFFCSIRIESPPANKPGHHRGLRPPGGRVRPAVFSILVLSRLKKPPSSSTEPDVAADSELDQGGGEGAAVGAHLGDVAHRRRGQAVGRGEDGARSSPASDRGRRGARRGNNKRAARAGRARPRPAAPLSWSQSRAAEGGGGGVTTPFSQAAATVSPSSGPSGAVVRKRISPGPSETTSALPVGRTLRPGIDGALAERDRPRQPDPRFGDVDRKDPAIAGGVPVELVIILEEAELAGGPVADRVDMLARRDVGLGIAHIDPDAIALALRVPGLVGAVALDARRPRSRPAPALRRDWCSGSGSRGRCRGRSATPSERTRIVSVTSSAPSAWTATSLR